VFRFPSQLGTRGQKTTRAAAAYTVAVDDDLILVDATAAPVTITLPSPQNDAVLVRGRGYAVMKTDASANVVTVNAPAGFNAPVGKNTLTAQNAWAVFFTDNQWFALAS
jgi:hypothetical protein